MSRFQKLVATLEGGSGATKLSASLKGITLTFSQRTKAFGARHFWRRNLPRVQYTNPNLDIVVNTPKEPCAPSLELRFADDTTKTIDIKGMKSDEICNKLLDATKP